MCLWKKIPPKPMQVTRQKRCQTRTRPRKKACAYGARVSGPTIFGYVYGNPLSWSDPTGLDVYLCKQPAFGIPNGPVDHHWLKTDTAEAGMGGTRGNVPGNESGDMPGDPVQVVPHPNRSKEPGASCQKIDGVDEKKVNNALKIGRPLGRWGPTNQCQTFARETLLDAGWKPPAPRPPGFSFGF
jgi:hypothetical protein